MKRLLITGASGYIGPYLCRELLRINSVLDIPMDICVVYNSHSVEYNGITSVKCDLIDSGSLTKLFNDFKPDTVIHLASGTPMRILEQEEDYIRRFNLGVTEYIAKLCTEINSLLIYTSTDLVYDEGVDLKEDSSPLNPLTIYAKTKLEGEEALKANASRYLILRTALVYGFTISSYTSFFDTAFAMLSKGEGIRAFIDQYRNPLYVEDAATVLAALPDLHKSNDIINFCGHEYLSRYDMCMLMCEMYGFNKSLVVPASCNEFSTYPMVKKLGLNCSKLSSLGFKTCTYRENLIKAMNFMPRKSK